MYEDAHSLKGGKSMRSVSKRVSSRCENAALRRRKFRDGDRREQEMEDGEREREESSRGWPCSISFEVFALAIYGGSD